MNAAPAPLSPIFRHSLLWIAGTAVMSAFTLMTLSAVLSDGQMIPAHNDAFYHARRILDAVMTGAPIAQFDPHMHVPEGSWVTWPWCYDSVMASIVRWFGPYQNEQAAMRVLAYIPVFAAGAQIALVVWAARLLRLGFVTSLLLVVGFACLPAVHASFSIGNVDHHFAEGMWATLALCGGIWFFRECAAGGRGFAPAAVFGLALGTACGVHVSLFILQIPLVGFYLLQWVRGAPLPGWRATAVLAGTLFVSMLALCLGSGPFRAGFFEFYTLSWFHLYIAAGTAVFVLLPALLARRPATIALLGVLGLAAATPLFASADLGGAFLGGKLDTIQNILEIWSPYRVAIELAAERPAPELLYLLWIAAPALAFNVWLAVKERDAGLRYFAVFACMGLALLQLQSRLHVFGELALVATPLVALRLAAERWLGRAFQIVGVGVAVFLVLLSPVRHRWGLAWRLAGAPGYAEIRGVFPVMKAECARAPGVLLADTEAGHWVRYHTACDVIGNLFLLTPQQAAKARETDALMRLEPASLPAAAPAVRYVLVYHTASIDPRHELDLDALRRQLPALESGLLGPRAAIPPVYELLWNLDTPGGQTYARLFAVRRPAGG